MQFITGFKNTLRGGEHEDVLRAEQYIESANGKYQLRFQKDGNLVIYDVKNKDKVMWATNTHGQDVDAVKMQTDGNLVMYHPGGKKSPWATATHGKKGTKAVLENWGDLVIYDGQGKIVWSSINDKKDRWMSNLDDNLYLYQICMPGSHDAGMYTTKNIARGLALTQGVSLKQQLELGARYFDLRPRCYGNLQFCIQHDMADGPELTEVLSDIASYCATDSFKSETIILNFTHFKDFTTAEQAKKFIELVIRHLEKYLLDKVPPETIIQKDMQLQSLRGSIILTIDNDLVKKELEKVNKPLQIWGKQFDCFDEYSNKQDYKDMISHQKDKFKTFNDDRLFLLNWTLTPRGEGWYEQATTVSEEFLKYIPAWAIARYIYNGNSIAVGKVEAYAREINHELITDFNNNTDLFQQNSHHKIVNIINLDFINIANVLPVCRYVSGKFQKN